MADINLQALVAPLLSGLAGGGLITFALQTWLGERLKGGIQAEYAEKLENLKFQLGATAAERNTLLNALTTRRFDAIAEIHAALLKFHIALGRLTAPTRSVGLDEQALLNEVADASEAFDKVLTEKQIFLSQLTETKVVKIRQMLVSNANLFQWTVSMNQHDPDRPLKWMEIEQTVRGPVTNAIGDLAAELRALMGDKPEA